MDNLSELTPVKGGKAEFGHQVPGRPGEGHVRVTPTAGTVGQLVSYSYLMNIETITHLEATPPNPDMILNLIKIIDAEGVNRVVTYTEIANESGHHVIKVVMRLPAAAPESWILESMEHRKIE